MPSPYGFQPYADRPTAALQARRAFLLALPRDFTPDEAAEVRAIEAELTARNVLSIGIAF